MPSSKPSRPKRDRRGRAAAFLGGTLVLLILVLGGYYWVRTTGLEQSLTQRNLRELSRIGRTVEGRINNLEKVLRSLAESCDRGRQELIPGLELGCFDDPPDAELEGEIETSGEEGAPTRLVSGCDWKWWNARGLHERVVDKGWLATDGQDLRAAYLTQSSRCEEEAQLVERFVAGTWDVELMRAVLSSDLFDAVVLVRPDGEAMLSEPAGSGVQIRELSPRQAVRQAAEGSEESPPARQIFGTAVEEPLIAGVRYRLFVQPLTIHLPIVGPGGGKGTDGATGPAGDSEHWAVAGLVALGRFRAESLQFGPPQLLFASLLLIFALLSLPFLRILLMGPRERLNVGGVLLVLISYVVMGGVLGLLLADYGYYGHLKRVSYGDAYRGVEGALRSVADQLEDNLTEEIGNALVELDRQTSEFRSSRLDGDDVKLEDREDWLPLTSEYPYSQMQFWVDNEGKQKAKWTSRNQNTPRTTVKERPYFRRLMEHRGWPRPDRRDRHFVLDSIRSKTTGEQQGVLSVGFCWAGDLPLRDCDEEKRGIAAMIIPPVSLDHPVLPPGVDFAVIEGGGRTLFHSRPERNLEENFFEETDGNPLLRSVVLAGVEHDLTTRYMGRDHQLHARRISGLPLYLVVTLDKGYLRTLNLEVLFVVGVLLVLYGLGVLVVFAGVEWLLRRRLQWAWPNLREPWRHVLQAGVLAAFAGELLFEALLPGLSSLHWSSFLVPLQAMGLSLVVLTHDRAESQSGQSASGDRPRRLMDGQAVGWGLAMLSTLVLLWCHGVTFRPARLGLQLVVFAGVALVVRLSTAPNKSKARPALRSWLKSKVDPAAGKWWYVGSLALTPLLIGLLPGYLLTQGLFRYQTEELVAFQQLRVASALEERDRRLHERSQEGRPPREYLCQAVERKLDLAFADFPYETCHRLLWRKVPSWASSCSQRGTAATDWCSWLSSAAPEPDAANREAVHSFLHGQISDRLPYTTAAAVEMRQIHEQLEKADWRVWAGDREGLSGGRAALLRGPYRELASKVPALRWSALGPWVALLVSVGLLALIARWLARRIFLADLPLPPEVDGLSELWKWKTKEPCVLFVCTRGTSRSQLVDDERIEYVNVMDLACKSRGDSPLPLPVVNKPVVCYDYFDHRFHEPEWNLRFLDLLERLRYVERKRVVLLTSCSPEDLLPLRAVASVEPDESEHRESRWIRLLGSFVTVRLPAAEQEKVAESAAAKGVSDRLEFEVEAEETCTEKEGKGHDERLRDRVTGYHRAIWTILGQEERLIVAQLAAGAVVNPESAAAIRRLEARGLVRRSPELRLLNDRFRRFVREQVPERELVTWEQEGAYSPWQQLRAPIYLGLAATALFLLVTQAELFDMATAFVSTIALAGGAALRLAVLLRRPAPGGRAEMGVGVDR